MESQDTSAVFTANPREGTSLKFRVFAQSESLPRMLG